MKPDSDEISGKQVRREARLLSSSRLSKIERQIAWLKQVLVDEKENLRQTQEMIRSLQRILSIPADERELALESWQWTDGVVISSEEVKFGLLVVLEQEQQILIDTQREIDATNISLRLLETARTNAENGWQANTNLRTA
jgi:hypothetical protein